MLVLSGSIINKSVLSLRTGGVIATIQSFIINPNNLKVEALYCQDRLSKKKLVLLYQDIRNVISQGVIVNDHDVLSTPDILVRLQEIIKINFLLLEKPVVTINKEKVGRVKDFAIDSETFYVQKIYVGHSLLKSLKVGQLSIDRSQVIEVTDSKIVIQDLTKTVGINVPSTIRNTLSSSA